MAQPVEPYARRRSDSRATTRTATAAAAALSDPFTSTGSGISRKRIANVVVLRGLETAGLHVQALVLEVCPPALPHVAPTDGQSSCAHGAWPLARPSWRRPSAS